MKSYMTNLMFNRKALVRTGLFLFGLLMLSIQDVQATHIVGGNLTYRCLGPNAQGVNQYEIRLTVRRDCYLGADNAPFDDPASIGFYDAVTMQRVTVVGFNGELRMHLNNNDTLNEILISDCSVVSGDVCVHTTTYVDTILLPFLNHGYLMAYQRCCRNMSITNLVNPDETGMTLIAELSASAQQTCNSSPQFNAFPPIYVCVNKPISFNSFATDVEDDSLVYSLCVPNAGGDKIFNMPQPPPNPPYVPVVYRPPYSLADLMGGVPLQINAQTGLITGTPNTIGQFVVGICVTAYDRQTKMLTGVTRRDFQFNVRQCREVPIALFNAPPLNCTDLTVVFDNASIRADEYKWIFDYDDLANSAMSTDADPTFTFDHSGFYNVALIVNDSNKFCYDTIVHQIGVFNEVINADFTYDVSSCLEDGIVLNVEDASSGFGNYPGCDWEWILTADGNIFPSTDTNPTFSFDIEDCATAFLAMVVTSCNGCTASAAKSFQVCELSIPFGAVPDHFCVGDTLQLLDTTIASSNFTYIWEGPGIDPKDGYNAIAYPGVSAEFFVTVTDGLCEITGSNFVTVQQLPILQFDYATDCKSLLVQFDNGSMNGTNYHWDFGDGMTSNEMSPSHVYTGSGNYNVVLSSADGCDVQISDSITANAITEVLDDSTVSCFKDSVELNPVYNGDYTYMWSPSEFLDDASLPNPTAGVGTNTMFYVTITQAGLEGCEIVDSILVLSPEDFTANAGADDTICSFEDVTLTGTTNLNNPYVAWVSDQGDTLSHALIYEFSPDTLTHTFTLVIKNELGCVATDEITIYRPAPGFVVDATEDTAYCNIQTITLSATSIPGVTLEWFNAAMDLIGTGNTVEVTPGPGSTTCYQVVGTDQVGCQVKENVCLTPTLFNIDLTDDQVICLGEGATLSVTDNNGQNLSYLWTPTGETSSSINVQPTDTTLYCVEVTNMNVGCKDTLCSTVVVSLFEPIDITITATSDTTTFTRPDSLFVGQSDNPDWTYEWSSTGGDHVDPVWNPIVIPPNMETVTYTVTVTNGDGCTATASITLRVVNPLCNEEDIFLPNAFTPNDDSYNDVLFVRSNVITSMELHIYSRWGQEVFSSFNILDGWDGTFKGKKLEPDVFGYYLKAVCINQASYSTQGNITLLK